MFTNIDNHFVLSRFVSKHPLAKVGLCVFLVSALIVLPAIACGFPNGGSTNPTPTTQVIVPASPTQDPNAGDLSQGTGPLYDTCIQFNICQVAFFVAKPHTTVVFQGYPYPVHWTVTSTVPGVMFSQSSGTFTKGNDSMTITVTAIPTPCQDGLIIISTTDLTRGRSEIPLICDPLLTLNTTATYNPHDPAASGDNLHSIEITTLSALTPGCSPGTGTDTGTLICTMTLNRIGSFQGNVHWEAGVNVKVVPSKGTIDPNHPIKIAVFIPCSSRGNILWFSWTEDAGPAYAGMGPYFRWYGVSC